MELDLGASGAEAAPATNADAVAAPAVLADVAAPADVAYDPLLEAVVAKKFPGYGKEPWIGEVIEGPDEKDRYCCLWEKDQSTTWHSRKVWVGERSWDQRGPFALSDRDAAEIYGKVVFWEGADATCRGGDFADLEVSAPEDWLRKPSSISLFPSGRCGATRAYLAAEISKRVEDRSTRVDALRSGDAALSASDSARLIVDKWLRFCDAAAERVDARRREVTAAPALPCVEFDHWFGWS
ncbi:hypothetical protein JL722_7735 [Aureococcus anophagefferens]|nr:hypothetical protein JL722_7735 [Aureococcus anophagefferens]